MTCVDQARLGLAIKLSFFLISKESMFECILCMAINLTRIGLKGFFFFLAYLVSRNCFFFEYLQLLFSYVYSFCMFFKSIFVSVNIFKYPYM